MEQFMLIFHGGSEPTSMSPEEMQAHMKKWMAWVEKLQKNGQYVGGEPLLPGGKLVSGAGGKNVIDGPYTEGKEVVGGYITVKAKNFDEAVSLTKDYPDFSFNGTVQVRQIMKLDRG